MLLLVAVAATAQDIERFEDRAASQSLVLENAEAKTVRRADGRALRVEFQADSRTSSAALAPEQPWDLSSFAGIAVDITNAGDAPVEVWLSAKSSEAGQKPGVVQVSAPVAAGKTETLRLYFDNNGAGPYWGMRGVPVLGPVTTFGDRMTGERLDPALVSSFSIALRGLDKPRALVIDNVRAFAHDSPLAQLVPHPFIDGFGQFVHADWPGKLASEDELRARRDTEHAALAAAPPLAGRDRFGGWAEGPQLEATGWFRSEKVEGKWWLVTPEGRLFFSIGMNCLYHGDETFIDGRDGWFAELPDGGAFAPFYGSRNGVHSMGGPIGGRGRTFNFYAANLLRKYGDDWHAEWRDTAYARLKAWGFNTIGNWARGDVLEHSPMPFTVNLNCAGVPAIEGATGFWGNMMDVYAPSFETSAEAVGKSAETYVQNPLVVGFFVDNELSWENIGPGTLASPPSQPARKAFIDMLKRQYDSIGALNAEWGTDAADWDSLRVSSFIKPACKRDLDAFVYAFAHRYFQTISEALKRHTPNHLYLGCRFARVVEPAIEACANVVDVVSFNIYRDFVRCDDWTRRLGADKPVIIGEFHFGATDRGMFHTGLRGAANQQERAECYRRYVESVAECPAFVGCHWFQYKDQPTTGRAMDGENFSVGFVNITDTPYPELVDRVTDVHARIYAFRYGQIAK